MDLRKSLFQLEQLSPRLARKLWELTPLMSAPLTLVMGFKVKLLTDTSVEVEIPYGRQNRNEVGQLQSSVLIAAAEYASNMLWKRHLNPELDQVRLEALQSQFFKPAFSAVRVRASLGEIEREKVLRKIRSGEEVTCELSVVVTDEKDQTVASVNGHWILKTLRPLALG
ncbi:MAG: DUF4442 domain-containing protein [Oligoflexia bacterium]|nr:DUF4442 domain-containing protein [Oligoflexia bacterium]